MPHFLAQAVVTPGAAPSVTELALAGLLAAKGLFDVLAGRRAEARRDRKLEGIVTRLEARIDKHQATTDLALQRIDLLVGATGENGVRGETKRAHQRIDAIEERERERLERKAAQPYERRSS